MEIRKRINQKVILRKNGTLDIGSENSEPTMTQQQYKDACDINNIVKTYASTGELPLSNKVGQFMDVSNVSDYQTALETVYNAQKAFDALPSSIRTKFENDPNQLIAFLEDDKNYNEAQKLGLLKTPQNQNDQTQTNEPKSPQSSPSPASSPS